ncbi:MAG: hypothetical protein ACREBS_01560 [Nitrososphaerales archaeon]
MSKEFKRNLNTEAELTKDEKELILKALAYYQVRLFDELSKNASFDATMDSEYRKITITIKKIHKTIEETSPKFS